MIDISTLSYQEVQKLEKQIQEYHKSKKGLRGYRVTFNVLYNPKNHQEDMLDTKEEFGDYIVDNVRDSIIQDFMLKAPEDLFLDSVEELNDEEIANLLEGK